MVVLGNRLFLRDLDTLLAVFVTQSQLGGQAAVLARVQHAATQANWVRFVCDFETDPIALKVLFNGNWGL